VPRPSSREMVGEAEGHFSELARDEGATEDYGADVGERKG